MGKDSKVAVLIDADNISYSYIDEVLEEARKLWNSKIIIKRIYGDWTQPGITGWKSAVMEYALHPIQQHSYTTKKNSTDFALVIDAMDMLYTHEVDIYILVSSDSDYTRLAIRLKEAGKVVIGMGEEKTPKVLVSACDSFVYLKRQSQITSVNKGDFVLSPDSCEHMTSTQTTDNKPASHVKYPSGVNSELVALIKSCITELDENEGWVDFSSLARELTKHKPGFSSKDYGYNKLRQLIKACDNFFVIDKNHTVIMKNKKSVKKVCVRII